MANTEAAQRILDGNYAAIEEIDYNLDDQARLLLEILARQGDSLDVPSTIEAQDFISYWRKAKESTSSSFSNRHFGHYKAASHCDTLSEMHSLMLQLSYGQGRTLHRWTTALLVMLEKEPGKINVEKL